MEQPTSTHFHEKQNKLKPFSPSHERREIWTTTHTHHHIANGDCFNSTFFLENRKGEGGTLLSFYSGFSLWRFHWWARNTSPEECRIQHYSTYYNYGRKPSLTGPFQLSESLWSKSIAKPYSTGLRAYFTFCSAFLWSFPYLPICGTFRIGSKQILLANPSNTCVSWASLVYYCGEPQNNTSKAVSTMVL